MPLRIALAQLDVVIGDFEKMSPACASTWNVPKPPVPIS